MKKILLTVLIAAGAAAVSHAQERLDRYLLTQRWALPVEGETVKGTPFSAEFVSETVQTLADGNRIVARTTGRIYRDKDGRVRREEDRPDGGATISVTDPVARTSFTLDPATRTVKQTALLIFALRKSEMRRELTARKDPGPARARGGGAGRGRGAGPAVGEETSENLPERTVEGVEISGVRRTTTIAKGAIGNEQPIKVVSEEWTSPELQTLVLSEFSDPRTGRRTYRLSKINRADPDPALFQIPSGYTVVKVPPPAWTVK